MLAVIIVFLIFDYRKLSKSIAWLYENKGAFRTIITLYLLMTLSTIWSVNPALSAYRSVESFAFLFLVIRHRLDIKNLEEYAVFWSYWGLLIGLLVPLVFRYSTINIANLHGFGVYYITSIFFFPKLAGLKYVQLLFGIVLIIATSAKSYIGFSLGWLHQRLRNNKNFALKIILLFVVISVIYAAWNSVIDLFFYGKTDEQIQNGSGRKQVWLLLLDIYAKRPFFGYGFCAGEKFGLDGFGTNVLEAHNSLLSLALSIGLLGPVLLLVLFFRLYKLSVKMEHNSEFWLIMLIMSFVFSLLDNSFGVRVSPAVLSNLALFIGLISYK